MTFPTVVRSYFGTVLDSNQSDCREFQFLYFAQESKGFTHKFTGDRKIYEFKTSAYVNDEVNRFANIVWIIPSWAKTL